MLIFLGTGGSPSCETAEFRFEIPKELMAVHYTFSVKHHRRSEVYNLVFTTSQDTWIMDDDKRVTECTPQHQLASHQAHLTANY